MVVRVVVGGKELPQAVRRVCLVCISLAVFGSRYRLFYYEWLIKWALNRLCCDGGEIPLQKCTNTARHRRAHHFMKQRPKLFRALTADRCIANKMDANEKMYHTLQFMAVVSLIGRSLFAN